ncbi:MAG: hypothetical protein QX199_19865 [Methylococcaceae bacterium]
MKNRFSKLGFGFLAVFTAFFPLIASAATITDGFDQPSSTQIFAASNHKFTITLADDMALGETMQIVFPTGFNLSSIIEDDVDLTDDGVDLTTAPDCTGTEQASAAVTSQTLTLSICPGDGGAIALASVITIEIGTNASASGSGVNRITNPSIATSYFVNIAGTSGNSGTIILATTTAGSASVSATVPVPSSGGGGGGGSTPPPAETPPPETPPAEVPPVEPPPPETPPAEVPPAEIPPAETPPAETSPAETSPAETPPTGGSPSPSNTGTGTPSSEPSPAPSGGSGGGSSPTEPTVPVPTPETPPATETPTESIPPVAEPEVSPQVAQTIATLPTVLQAPATQIAKTISQVSRVIAQASLAVQKILEPLAAIQALPEVKATVDVAIPLTVAAAATTTIILASSFSLLPYLQFIFTSPLLFIARRKRKSFGVIYHSLSKVAIDLATVRLYDAVTNRLVRSIVTDAQGKYCLVVNPGQYRMVVAKHGFIFPSTVLKDVKDDGPYLDVYTGQYITVSDKDATIGVNVPLDPIEASSAVTLRRMNVKKMLRSVQRLLSVSGVLLSVLVWTAAPSPLTAVLAIVQMVVFLLFWRLAQPKKPKGWGIVYDATNKVPVGNAVVRLFEPAYNKLVETVLTDSLGRYSFLVGPNEYFVRTNKEGYDENIVRPIDYRAKTEPDAIAIDVPLTPTKPL